MKWIVIATVVLAAGCALLATPEDGQDAAPVPEKLQQTGAALREAADDTPGTAGDILGLVGLIAGGAGGLWGSYNEVRKHQHKSKADKGLAVGQALTHEINEILAEARASGTLEKTLDMLKRDQDARGIRAAVNKVRKEGAL